MVVILFRLGVLLFADAVDEAKRPPVGDTVVDGVVRVLRDNDQPRQLTRMGLSKTDLNKDEEDEEVLVTLEVLFADCVYRSQR